MQMWVVPAQRNTEPRYEQRTFADGERRSTLKLCVSPDGEGDSLTIGQDARMYTGLFDSGETVTHDLTAKAAYLHVAEGSVTVNGQTLHPGDGAEITDESEIEITGVERANVVLWEFPAALVVIA